MDKAQELIGSKVKFCNDPYAACRNSDALLLLTEWDEFKEIDFTRIKKLLSRPLIIDGRNLYDPGKMSKMGFKYIGIGRGAGRK
jgi:UDPglucose 6-dehydrogenase